jgi:AbrB family looped-hinge helix DNA binding protein
MSSRGQVVIPEEIRERLGLEPGDRFVVIGEDDVVILKVLKAPRMSELSGMLREARDRAYEAGMKRSDIERAVKKARKKK